MGPGDDAPIVGGESAQSHPTRDVSYTHLNAMNSQRWGNVHRECLSQIVIDQVFSLYSFMYIGSHDIHSTVGPFFLNVCMTITLRNADYGCRRRWNIKREDPNHISIYMETYKEIYGQAQISWHTSNVNHILLQRCDNQWILHNSRMQRKRYHAF